MSAMAGAGNTKPRALGIVGDFYHPHAELRDFFLRAAPELEWTFERDPGRVDWTGLAAYSLLALSAENRVDPESSDALWMDEETGRRIADFVASGGGLLAHHSGLASYPEGGAYRRLLGGGFQFHPRAMVEFSVVPAAEHPLLAGIGAFSVSDEMYFVDREPATTLALAVSESPRYGSTSAAWLAERGLGRVACVCPGHRPEVLRGPSLARLVGGAARWCARPMS